MARTVDYLPVATQTGANVEAMAAYQTDPIRLAGHSAGVAKSAVANRMWRQSSVIAAALAKVISDALNVDILDDGDVDALADKLKAVMLGGKGIVLTGAANYYIAPSPGGSDSSGDGSVDRPWATIQHAYDYITDNLLNLNNYPVTINLAAGTYSAGLNAETGIVGGGMVTIAGVAGNPSSVTVNVSGANCFTALGTASLRVKDMTLLSGIIGGAALWAVANGRIHYSGCRFGVCAGVHLYSTFGGVTWCDGDCDIVGGAVSHSSASAGGSSVMSGLSTPVTLTLVGTPAFTQFVSCDNATLFAPNNTFVGGATGSRYLAQLNGVIYSDGSGPNYFPGSTPGTTATGGQYH